MYQPSSSTVTQRTLDTATAENGRSNVKHQRKLNCRLSTFDTRTRRRRERHHPLRHIRRHTRHRHRSRTDSHPLTGRVTICPASRLQVATSTSLLMRIPTTGRPVSTCIQRTLSRRTSPTLKLLRLSADIEAQGSRRSDISLSGCRTSSHRQVRLRVERAQRQQYPTPVAGGEVRRRPRWRRQWRKSPMGLLHRRLQGNALRTTCWIWTTLKAASATDRMTTLSIHPRMTGTKSGKRRIA